MDLSKIKLFIFDLDGTLIEYEHDFLFAEAHRLIQEMVLNEYTIDHFKDEFMNDHCFTFIEETERRDFETLFWSKMRHELKPLPRLIDHTLETLEFLTSKNKKIGIATARSTPPHQLKEELIETGLTNYTSVIKTRHEENKEWRDKTLQIQEVCNAFNIHPHEACMVGDNPSDFHSAKRAGVKATVAVRTGLIKDNVLISAQPDFLIDSVSGLIKILSEQ